MSQNFKKEFFRQFDHSLSCGLYPDANYDMYEASDQQDELAEVDEVVARLLEGDMDRKKLLRQQQWLLTDRGAVEHYVQYTYLYVALNILLNKKQDISFLKYLVMV